MTWFSALLMTVPLGLTTGATFASNVPDAVEVRVSPAASNAPATVRVTVTVPPHPDNREVTIELDCVAYYTSTSDSLEGEDEPRTTMRVFKALPAGEYEVRAILERAGGDELVDIATLLVV